MQDALIYSLIGQTHMTEERQKTTPTNPSNARKLIHQRMVFKL